MKKIVIATLVIISIHNSCSFAQSAINFSGTNSTTYVKFGNNSKLGLAQFTLECWFKRTGAGTSSASTGTGGLAAALPLVTKGRSESDGSTVDCNYFMGINTGTLTVLAADFEEGSGGTTPGLNHPIFGTTTIVNNVWYHAAATYDGSTWKLYLNGNLEATLTVNQPVQNLSIQHSAVGSALNSTGAAAGFFGGVIDEARVWNSARSQAQIQATANSQLSTPQSGMVARWGLDEGAGTTVGDISGISPVATGTIVGTAFTWTTSIAPFNLTFTPVNYSPNLTVNTPANNNMCMGGAPVNLSVNVSDPNASDALKVNFYGRPKKQAPADFTIIGIPDTQFYTEQGAGGGSNNTFKAQTNWIVANKDALKIAHVSQLGDCVQNGDNGGNDIEWKRADTSMAIIENPVTTNLPEGLPYSMNVGNHDQSPGGDASGTTTFFNQYFGTARFSGRTYWGGNYGSNADNSYQLFSANSMDFIVVSLEYDPLANPAVLTWANGLLQTYSSRKAIIVSHWIINADGTYGAQGAAIYNALKANTNLFLMLCGHINPNGEARRSDVFNGKTVHTLLSDYQDLTGGGSGWLRIMTISPSTNTMSVKTFSPTLNQYQTDANSQFTLSNLNLYNDPTAYQLLSTQTVTGSGTLSYSWNSLLADSTYEWYTTVADTQLTVTSAVRQFSNYTSPTVSLGTDITLQCGDQLTLNAANAGNNYLWSIGITTNSITVSTAGNYFVKVTNPISGCFAADTIKVTVVNLPSVSIITSTVSANCSGSTIMLTATGGMIAYSWSNGATTQAINVSASGNYTVTVTSFGVCQNTASQSIVLTPPLSVTYTVTNVSCFGGANGSINATGINGVLPYTYSWNTGATTKNISTLTQGTYTLSLTDNVGCIVNAFPVVIEPTVLSLTAPTITTTNGGYNGTIKVNPTGGTLPYTYLWRYNNAGANITTQTLSTTHVGGIYTTTVTDSKGCSVSATYSHVIPVVASSTVLLPWSSTWKYKDDGSNQGTSWRGISFDDSSWPSAATEFGYGDGDETTLINACGTIAQTPSCTNKYLTTYLRRIINIPDLSGFQNIKFNAFRDDGIIVYVNNNEVYRSGIPAGVITYTTTLSSSASDDGETLQTTTVPVASSFFIAGDNTIAVEVHQQNGSSSDVTFNMEILGVAPIPEVLTRGPYLQKLTSNSITIRWNTDQAVKSQVNYGTDSLSLSSSVVDNANSTTHSIVLTGLNPYTKYYYSIGSPTLTLQGNGKNYFLTAPLVGTEGKYNFWLVGDCGNNSTNQAQVRDKYVAYMGNTPTNGWLLLGDNAYSNGADAEYQAEFFNVYQGSIMKNAPLYPAPGNHDYNNGGVFDHSVPYYTLFDMPSNGEAGGVASGTKAYYSYDYGNAHFLSLDSYGKEDGVNRLYDTLGQQVQWIKQDLAANTNKKFVIAYWHHPPYTMGSHNSDTESELTKMHTNFIKILENYGVDLIVCGHSHEYERSKLIKGSYGNEASFDPLVNNLSQSNGRYDGTSNSCTYLKDSTHSYNGTIYVVTGSAGQLDGNVQAAWPHNAMSAYNNSTNGGSSLLTIEGNRLDLKWICADGVIRDQFTLIKDANKVRNYTVNYGQSLTLQASWKGQYVWSASGATTQSINITPNNSIAVTVSDQYQCVADTFKINVIMPTIAPVLINSTVCVGVTVKVPFLTTGTFSAGNVFTVQLSDASGNFTNPVNTGTLTAVASNTITAIVPGNTPNGSNYRLRIVSSNPAVTSLATTGNLFISTPVATINSSDADNIVCEGTFVTLSAPDNMAYFWSNGATTQSINVSVTGNYSVTVSSNGCSAISPLTNVTVNALPSAVITPSGNTTFCQGSSVNLNAPTGTYSYLWSTNATTQIINVSTSGNYSLTVTNVNTNCSANSPVKVITVNPLPTVSITPSGSTNFCQGSSVTLNASAGTYNYVWSTNVTTQSINITTAGNYSVNVTDLNTNCSASSPSITVIVNPLPSASIMANGNTTFCQGSSVNLNAPSGTYKYLWSTNATTQAITVSTSGSYSVSVTDINTNCSAGSPVKTVVVNSLPTALIIPNGSTTFCQGSSVILNAPAGNYTYAWSTGATAQSINVVTSGSYSVAVNSSGGCSSSSPVTMVIVNSLPSASITANGSTTFCIGSSVMISAPTGTYKYLWSTNATTQSINVTASGNYFVNVTNATTNCSASSPGMAVTVNPLPSGSITPSGSTTFCQGESVTLNALSGNYSYSWSNGSTSQNITTAISGTYSVVITDNFSGCSATYSGIVVNVNALPSAPIVNSFSVCEDLTIPPLTTIGNNIIWYSDAGLTVQVGIGNNFTMGSITPGSYTFYVTQTDVNGCVSFSDSATITINALPAVNISGLNNQYFVTDAPVILTGTPIGGTFSGTGISGNQFDPATAGVGGPYTVVYSYADANTGCADTASASVNVIINTGIVSMLNGNKVQLYPNPANEQMELKIILSGTYPVQVELYDIIGRGILVQPEKQMQIGTHSLIVDRSNLNLSFGTYWLKVKVGEQTSIIKIIFN